MNGTVWDYEYEECADNGEVQKKTLRLVYNLRALTIYYNFFGSDMMGDFYKSSIEAKKKISGLPDDIKLKIANGDDLTDSDFDNLTDDELNALTDGIVSSNSTFVKNATVAMIAAGENALRSAETIADELPITINGEAYRVSLIEFISFCDENTKKNRIVRMWTPQQNG